MRTIKFRVWTGLEMEYNVMVGKFGIFYVNPSNNGIDVLDSASISPFNTKYPNDIPLMQFTGLTSKNGKEIFEGDICHSESYYVGDFEYKAFNGKVVFIDGCYLLDGIGENGFELDSTTIHNNDIVVIGNIHENPELL